MAAGPVSERNQDATIYVGGLDEKVNESLLWELFVQAGPVVNVHMPKDRVTMMHQGYGFVEFLTEEDADYSIKILNMIKLYGKPIRINKASANQKNLDVGANIFVGNLDPEVDEKLIYDTFSAFGVILTTPKIQRDPDTGNSKGFAFVNYGSFEASDTAIDSMNGQYLCNRAITLTYAYKKDSTHRADRHGSAAERFLAAKNPISLAHRPHQLFSDAPNTPNNCVTEGQMAVRPRLPPLYGLQRMPMIPPPPPGLRNPGIPGMRNDLPGARSLPAMGSRPNSNMANNTSHNIERVLASSENCIPPPPPGTRFPLPGSRLPPQPGSRLPLPPGTRLPLPPGTRLPPPPRTRLPPPLGAGLPPPPGTRFPAPPETRFAPPAGTRFSLPPGDMPPLPNQGIQFRTQHSNQPLRSSGTRLPLPPNTGPPMNTGDRRHIDPMQWMQQHGQSPRQMPRSDTLPIHPPPWMRAVGPPPMPENFKPPMPTGPPPA